MLLLKCGAKVNYKCDTTGTIPLLEVVDIMDKKLILLLLMAGADIHARDVDGCGVLHCLVNPRLYEEGDPHKEGKKMRVIKLLEKFGVALDMKNNSERWLWI